MTVTLNRTVVTVTGRTLRAGTVLHVVQVAETTAGERLRLADADGNVVICHCPKEYVTEARNG